MVSDRHISQDEIVAPIRVHRQLPIEGESPKQSMAIQKSDILRDQYSLYQHRRKLPHNCDHPIEVRVDSACMLLLWVQMATSLW
jgi:hypothetical protein